MQKTLIYYLEKLFQNSLKQKLKTYSSLVLNVKRELRSAGVAIISYEMDIEQTHGKHVSSKYNTFISLYLYLHKVFLVKCF